MTTPHERRRARRLVAAALRRTALRRVANKVRRAAPPAPRPQAQRSVDEVRKPFFAILEREGDFADASVAVVRSYLNNRMVGRARTFAQVLQLEDGHTAAVGNICMAVAATHSQLVDDAWRFFAGADLPDVLRFAPTEYFRVAFALDPEVAVKVLDAVLRDEYVAGADADGWLDIARTSFVAGALEQSLDALGRAERGLADVPDRERRHDLGRQISRFNEWYLHATAARERVTVPAGEIPIGVMSYRQPDDAQTSRDLGDYFDSLASLTQLVRHSGVRFTGDPELVGFADVLRERVAPAARFDGEPAVARLHEVFRDATSCAAVPDGTWLIVAGLLPRPMFGAGTDLPLNPRLRPIFASVHIDDTAVLTTEVIDYLHRHAPIGCRDWSTVLLLQAAGVPAFLSGALAATFDTLAPADPARPTGRLFVDAPAKQAGDRAPQVFDAVDTRSLPENLHDALNRIDGYRRYRRIVTSRLQTYAAARGVDIGVELIADNPAQRCWYGLAELDDTAFAQLRAGLRDRLAEVYRAILAGADAEDVYALWRRICAPDVARADALRGELPELPPPSFDFRDVCATIRAAAVTIERAEEQPAAGSEINVEFSLDANYKHQLEVVLDSIVTHASRPVRAFVLCREHTYPDFVRMAALFPTVSFVWLPTDEVEYGSLRGLLRYTTVATMDRLLLPDVLPDVGRIIHHDLDALCLADLAELYDIDLAGTPLGGCRQEQLKTISGFGGFMNKGERFGGDPARGHDYLRLSHARHEFDFDMVNAGIMLLDLEVMRADRFCERFLPYVERFHMNDQGVLNHYAGGNRVELPRGWNWRPWLGSIPEPKIAHWAGPLKPWQRNWVQARELWRATEARLAERYARAGL